MMAMKKLIIAVEENPTAMKTSPKDLRLPYSRLENSQSSSNIVVVHSYAEAAGVLLAHKSGIPFDSITSNVGVIPITEL